MEAIRARKVKPPLALTSRRQNQRFSGVLRAVLELAPSVKRPKLRSCLCLCGNGPKKARKQLHSSAAQLLAPSTCPNYAPAGVCEAEGPKCECRCMRKLPHSSADAGRETDSNPAPAGVCEAGYQMLMLVQNHHYITTQIEHFCLETRGGYFRAHILPLRDYLLVLR